MELVTQRSLRFAYPRSAVWGAMGDVDSYQRWWPWLRSFEARALATGEEWRCTVRAPLGYTVSFVIAFDDVVTEQHAVARVSGDITGTADLTLDDTTCGGGEHCCEVVVRSDLQPRSGFLRVLATAVPPVARYGHDWILSTGAAQFEARGLSATSGARDTTK